MDKTFQELQKEIEEDRLAAIGYAYYAIQGILESNPDISPEDFVEKITKEHNDMEASIEPDYEAVQDDVVTVMCEFLPFEYDKYYLYLDNGKLGFSDEFDYTMGDDDWMRWKFTKDEESGKIYVGPV